MPKDLIQEFSKFILVDIADSAVWIVGRVYYAEHGDQISTLKQPEF